MWDVACALYHVLWKVGGACVLCCHVSCVLCASTALSTHGVGAELLFCLDFWARAGGGGGGQCIRCPFLAECISYLLLFDS